MSRHAQGITAAQPAVLRAKGNIVDNSSPKELVFNTLEGKPNGAGSDTVPIKCGTARAGRKQTGENACKRCLARSRIAHEKGKLSRLDFQVNSPQLK